MSGGRIEPVDHGGDLEAARRRFPAAPQPWIDLSTGINPHAYPLPAFTADDWHRLPQSSAQKGLLEAAARRYGAASADMVVAAPGSQALIQILPRLMDPTNVAILGPTYAEHAVAWSRCGHRVFESTHLDDMTASGVVVVVNPNNPTGRIVAADELQRLAAALEQRRGLLVVDEAFVDFSAEVSLVPQLPSSAIVLRSFGKTYGLGGLRLGFAIARPDLARRLRADLGPWTVSGPALIAGAKALADGAWIEAMRSQLERDCTRLDAMLRTAGFAGIGGTHLFRLVQHPRAHAIADALGRHGIYVRRFSAQHDWLRFGLPGSETEWARLSAALGDAC